MADINFQEFLAGLNTEQQAAMAAAMYKFAPDAATSALQNSPAAQALVSTVVKPARVSKRGPSFWDNFWADALVLEAAAAHLGIEDDSIESVMSALQSRLDKASVTGTFDRKDEDGNIHKMRLICIDETAKTTSQIQKRIEAVVAADSAKALTDAVTAATKSLSAARALPASTVTSLTGAIEEARESRANAIEAASEAPPVAPPSADLPAPPA